MSKVRPISRLLLSLGACAALASCHGGSANGDVQADGAMLADADDWPSFGRSPGEQHYSPLHEIDGGNVGKLALAWHYDLLPGFTASEPVEAEGKVFLTTGHSLITALDATTGKLLWEYDGKTRERATSVLHMSWGNKGLAYWNGRVFIATTDGLIIAIDAKTGKEVWRQRDFPATDIRNINGPPRVFDGKVIIGHGGADISPIRGYVSAYDATSGKLAWRFHTVPGDPSKPATDKAEQVMRPTWKGDWYGKGGGGTAWNAFSYDPELKLLYIGVGNGFPYNQKLRSPGGGDNLFLASIVAVKVDTGEYVWHYQTCPGEQWDCTATQDMTLATIEIDGKPRKVLMQAPKNGFFYVIDRATGQYISAGKIAKITWASGIDKNGRPIENPGIRYAGKPGLFQLWPGPQGAHSWLPQAFSPRTGLAYIPVIEDGALIGDVNADTPPISRGMGTTLVPDADMPGNALAGYLKAWDPVAQKAAWTVKVPGAWPGGVMATAGDLVFQGRIDGQFVAYDAKTGKQLWSFKAQAPIVAPPISFRVKGRQYVTVLTGNGSSGGGIQSKMVAGYNTDYRLPRHVLTFAIDGKDSLPPFTPPVQTPPADPGFVPDPAILPKGGMAFAVNGCMVCHGMNAVGGGSAPDLRWSPVITDREAFATIVKGALKPNGMPAFPQIPDDMLESIRHYLRFRAQQSAVEAKGGKAAAPASQAVSGG